MAFESHARAWVKSVIWRILGITICCLPINRELEPEDLKLIENQLKKLGYLD